MPRVFPGSSRVKNEPQIPKIGFWFDVPLVVPLHSRKPDSEPLQTVYKKGRVHVCLHQTLSALSSTLLGEAPVNGQTHQHLNS